MLLSENDSTDPSNMKHNTSMLTVSNCFSMSSFQTGFYTTTVKVNMQLVVLCQTPSATPTCFGFRSKLPYCLARFMSDISRQFPL
jgi:hypothetical protein